MARCLICFLRFPKLKNLYIHYLKLHKKISLIYKLLQATTLNSKILLKNKKYKQKTTAKNHTKKCKNINTFNIEDLPTESLVLSENIRIFCGDNEIIRIGDNKHSVKLSFEDDDHENKEICCLTLKEIERQKNEIFLPETTGDFNETGSYGKKKIKRRKLPKRKKQNYKINTRKIKGPHSPTNQNGIFENGLEPEQFPKSDLRLLTSDTESCSETSKNSFVPLEDSKLFCPKCGSGYKTDNELSEHMYIHEPFCRLCNTWFPDEFTFKQHMQLHKIRIFACHVCSAEYPFKEMLFKHFDCHMEDRIFEDVLNMEEDYKTFQFSFVNSNYNTSINSILCYLKDRSDISYCNYKYINTACDICYKEVLINEYERHLQIFHGY